MTEPAKGTSSPRVAVIVLNYCNEQEAAAGLEAVLRSRYDALDVVLVDNASPDGSGDRLHSRFPSVHYVPSSRNGGYGAGNNLGFEWVRRQGTIDYVLVLNDDTEIDPDCIAHLVRAAEETGAAAVAPQILYYDEPEIVWYAGGSVSKTRIMCTHFGENGPIDPSLERKPITFICGCCFLLRTDVLSAVGDFDERLFIYVEDLEFSLRLLAGNHRMLYEPRARVLHRIERGAKPTANQIRWRDKNRRRVAQWHFGLLGRLRFRAWFYPTRCIHLATHVALGEWELARAQLNGAFGSLRG